MRVRNIEPGEKFGKLTVISQVVYVGKDRHKRYLCKCECGNETIVASQHLGKDIFSCGCLVNGNKEVKPFDRLYRIYKDIKRRCYNPQRSVYKFYGGKGIKMCDEWLNDYSTFKEWAIKSGYTCDYSLTREERLSIDRIDSKKDYEPSNCRWLVFKDNRRRAIYG